MQDCAEALTPYGWIFGGSKDIYYCVYSFNSVSGMRFIRSIIYFIRDEGVFYFKALSYIFVLHIIVIKN